MNRALIVGGAGFIGSHLVDLCLERMCEVWVYDNFSTGRREFLAANHALHVVEGDILDSERLSKTVHECCPDVMYHLAAIHHIPTCENHPEHALRVNVEGTQIALASCTDRVTPRIVFASTGALYDPTTTGPLTESSATRAHDIYSISKLAGEQLLQYHAARGRGQGVIARLFNAIGRRETNSHVIPAIVAQLAAGNRQLRLGNLQPRRDYVHVEDIADALFLLGGLPLAGACEVFNIGSGQEVSVGELVELWSEVIAEPIEAVTIPELQRKLDRPSQLADLTKIQQTSGWRPTRSLNQALSEVWEESKSRHPRRDHKGSL